MPKQPKTNESEVEETKEEIKSSETPQRVVVVNEMPSGIPGVTRPFSAGEWRPMGVGLDLHKDGEFKNRMTGEKFKLRIVEATPENFGRTHQLKNEAHFVELSEQHFYTDYERI